MSWFYLRRFPAWRYILFTVSGGSVPIPDDIPFDVAALVSCGSGSR